MTGAMSAFTFYLYSGCGSALRLETFELGGDEFGPDQAVRMLGEHPGCAYLTVRSKRQNPPSLCGEAQVAAPKSWTAPGSLQGQLGPWGEEPTSISEV
jgi:hypothetical protein